MEDDHASLAEFDRRADAAAKRETVNRQKVGRTHARHGDGPTSTLRCPTCSYHLRTFARPVTVIAKNLVFPQDREMFERQVRPRLTRPWRSLKCRHCRRTTVYYT